LSQISLLFRLYLSPLKTFSRILDEGRLLFAVAAAVGVLLVMQFPRAMEYQVREHRETMQRMKARVQARIEAAKKRAASAEEIERATESEHDIEDIIAPVSASAAVRMAAERFTASNPTQYFSPLIAMAICFVPAIILVLTLWDNLGGFSTILFRDYMALLVCCLLAWSAAYLVLAPVNAVLYLLHVPAFNHPALWWAAHAYFLLLTALAVRTLLGTSFSHAVGATAGAWFGAVGGIWMYSTFGNVTGYLASPFVLYYLYQGVGPQLNGLGGGLVSRQRLKRGLENATLNPRDADAHYQLGLIYAQRRQHDAAMERFRKAIEVEPKEADAHYQLGRIAREQGRYADALEHCQTAARIDDKHSSSEVWREIGIVQLLAGDAEAARSALERYLDRRPYDPEGLCWYGRTMAKLGHRDEARSAFDQAIESVRTMPAARRRQVRSWEGEARRELKKLPAAAVTA
jgi:Flp pilus assembly protein TadD